MPRHENTPLHADSRLNRSHPDMLPTHRQCPDCLQVLPLDAEQFYEVASRFPWNLSRFDAKCKPCTRKNSLARAAARKPIRNAKDRQQRAQAKAGLQAVLVRPIPEEEEAQARRFRIALLKRSIRRVRGPYSIATDPIKMMIRQRQEHARQRVRMREASVAVDAPLSQLNLDDDQRGYLERLRDLRDDPGQLGGGSGSEQAKEAAVAPVRPQGWLPFGVSKVDAKSPSGNTAP